MDNDTNEAPISVEEKYEELVKAYADLFLDNIKIMQEFRNASAVYQSTIVGMIDGFTPLPFSDKLYGQIISAKHYNKWMEVKAAILKTQADIAKADSGLGDLFADIFGI